MTGFKPNWQVPVMSAFLVPRPLGPEAYTRMSLGEMFMAIAETAAQRSTCPKGKQHGAVIVIDGHVVSMGYNGPPHNWPNCNGCEIPKDDKGKDFRNCPAVHAEANALLQAARFGTKIAGGKMFVTKYPCMQCRLLIENSGLQVVFYKEM